jgi:hypothetical protein
VVTGGQHGAHVLQRQRGALALAGGQPGAQFFEAPQRTDRFGQGVEASQGLAAYVV